MDVKIKKMRELNGNLQQNFIGGRVLIKRGVAELPIDKQLKVSEKVRNFSNFNNDNDQNDEHDFGAFDVEKLGNLEDLVNLVSKIPEIYESSNFDEKRKVLKLLYSNFLLEGKNPLFSIRKPLENILSRGLYHVWSGRHDSNMRHLGPKPSTLPG